jgi:acetyltransferase-like isoleucine patch superfamily enzyme
LNLLGHKVSSGARIGFSLIWISGRMTLDESTSIGHFNIIKINSLSIDKGGYIGRFNKIKGPIEIILRETAAIGNGNSIDRAPIGVTYGKAVLQLGILSKLTANHRIDCTRSIIIGDYSTVAGHDSQLWTHAYYHDKTGPGRFRVDGEIEIGNNVYIGSRCIINGGVKIADTVVIGSNSSVSKSLTEPGTYVNQPLRFIGPHSDDDARAKFRKVKGHTVCEEVYEKKD